MSHESTTFSIDSRDIRFALFDLFRIQDLLKFERFHHLSRDEMEMLLSQGERMAIEVLSPLNRVVGYHRDIQWGLRGVLRLLLLELQRTPSDRELWHRGDETTLSGQDGKGDIYGHHVPHRARGGVLPCRYNHSRQKKW